MMKTPDIDVALPHVTEEDQLELYFLSLIPVYGVVGLCGFLFHVVHPCLSSVGIIP